MTHLDKIGKAKAKLMLEHPYFGTLASALELKSSDSVESFLSDGAQLQYSEHYFDEISLEEVEFALANGAMHTVLGHQNRAAGRQGRLWQLATDYTINAMLARNGLPLPQRARYQERFEGMYAEEIYEILRMEAGDEIVGDDGPTAKESDENHRESSPKKTEYRHYRAGSFNNTDEGEEEGLQEYFEQLFQKLKRQGNLPKDLEFVVPHYFSHRIAWRERLYRYLDSYAKSTYTFVPPNMKYLYRGIYLPSLSSDLLRIVIAVDTSGSIDEKLLALFLAEVSSIMQNYPNYEIDMITADTKIQQHYTFLPAEPLSYRLTGGGGTDFRPVFKYIDENLNYPTLLLYFTDGQGTFPETEPNYDVIWVMPKSGTVPFGETIFLKETSS